MSPTTIAVLSAATVTASDYVVRQHRTRQPHEGAANVRKCVKRRARNKQAAKSRKINRRK